ncbi:hypothetical protein LTR56_011114 [Elasticomyces elasticus]|nr:hypothetical protein LTR56_011114 [Elasticomyces elasticus]KAK3662465.1 hypothetical protein LTR22_006744 [Elasticomyces elasticus]KAK4926454.1 hypothetical protein LTR49_006661 [Elasticomyces elasticus]KAK5761172.1 hypothetical protein LTS12_008653 [Elasticomyces elasticus]
MVPGMLTKSGMLYEGNHAAWEERMQGILAMHGYDVTVPDDKDGLLIEDDNLDEEKLCKATALISNYARGELLSRVRNRRHNDPNGLIRSLRTLAKPFQLNDLPPELRARVYSHHFGQMECYTCIRSLGKIYHTFPSLLLVSRAVRLEALSVFYRSSEFTFTFYKFEKKDVPVSEAVAVLRRWSRLALKQGVRDLRHLSVCMASRYPATVVVELGVLNNKGLMVTFEGETKRSYFTGEQKEAWGKHVEQVEADRQALGLLGEALILAFTSKPELWGMVG